VAECDASFYPKCVEQAEARLAASTPAERTEFLLAFTDTGCLETCDSAKSCFDLNPLCSASASNCNVQAQCCGFWKADAQCVESTCCQPDGVACGDDTDCCTGACLDFEGGKTCGGIECAPLDVSCSGDVSCCGELRCSFATQQCVRCEELDGACESGADCCSDYCDNAETGAPTGICSNPTCGLLREQDCQSARECCDEFCVPVTREGRNVCNDMDCIPNGFGCGDGGNCCSGSCIGDVCSDPPGCSLSFGDTCTTSPECCEGTCDVNTSECCLLDGLNCTNNIECCGASTCSVATNGAGTTCQGIVPCTDQGLACGSDGECCSQICAIDLGYCCKTVDDVCSHSVCVAGDPLSPECSNVQDPDGVGPPGMKLLKPYGNPGCIEEICEQDPFCCCNEWDDVCVDGAPSTSLHS
jgi:hypothetical protein